MSTIPRISYARSADGVSLAFTVTGDGPALVIVPWVPFSNLRTEWQNPVLRHVFTQFAQRLTLIQYDGRGTGHSQRDVTDLSLEAMVSDLEAVVTRAGAAKVCLLAQYNACPHAIVFAAQHPQRVSRMALFGGSARGWNAMGARQTQALLSLIEQDWDLFADAAAHQWMGWAAGDAGRAMADSIRGAVTQRIARATMQQASAVDVTDQLRGVAAPTLVLHRRGMAQIPPDVPRALAADLPRGRLVVLEGERPSLFLEDSDEVVRLLTGFFRDGIEPAGSAWTGSVPAGSGTGSVPAGSSWTGALSRRELDVLRLLAAGETNSQIARRLGVSLHTVERHVANLYRKIGARGRADATAYAVRSGLA